MSNFSIITYTDDINKCKILSDSCKKRRINLEYTGLDMPYQRGVNIKIKWIQKYLEDHKQDSDDKILLFLDGYDTILTDKF